MSIVYSSHTTTIMPGVPSLISATISTNGTTWTLIFNKSVSVGGGGNGGFTPTMTGGADALAYSSGSGSTTLIYTGGRAVVNTETGTLAYVQPGNGIEATSGGSDVVSFGSAGVTNNSTQTSGGAEYDLLAISSLGDLHGGDALNGDLGASFTNSTGQIMRITKLGRYEKYASGNRTLHVRNSSGTSLGSVVLDTTGLTNDVFQYATLGSHIDIADGTKFYIFSTEPNDGAQFLYDDGTVVTVASGVTAQKSAYGGGSPVESGSGRCYVPINAKFQLV